MSRILITGGAGFIGSNLCEYLVKNSANDIICVDNLYSGSLQNIEKLMGLNNFQFIQHDIEEKLDIKIDEIYNLACPASPHYYQKNPIKTTKTCVIGTMNMLELALENNAKILQASTSEVYGDPLEHPQKESYFGNVNTIGIRSCYDEGKRCAETFMADYHRQKNVKSKIVRIFNTYGPNMQKDDGRVVSNFIIQALENEDITIYGTGSQTRSFCYVDDLVIALVKMMATEESFIGPVNLGNPCEITIEEFAQDVIKLTNSKSKVVLKPLPQDDPQKRKPNISLAKEKLSWTPKIDRKEGLIRTIEYFKKVLLEDKL